LALFGRRPAERVVRSVLPASENLRKLRTRLPAFYVRFDRLRTLRLSREVFGFVSRGDA
jgi:hypothetical protein